MHSDVFIYGILLFCGVGCCEVVVKRARVESTKIECNMLLKAIVIYGRFDSVNVDEATIVKRRDLCGKALLWHLVSCEGHRCQTLNSKCALGFMTVKLVMCAHNSHGRTSNVF
jgi:hypothetical protein